MAKKLAKKKSTATKVRKKPKATSASRETSCCEKVFY